MLRLIMRLSVILAIALSLYAGTFWIEIDAESQKYTGAYIDKVALLETHEPGTVIVVGGSYSVFGLDPDILSNQLEMPVINTGLHAGIGLRFVLDTVLPHIQRGDVIILALEYDYYFGAPDTSSSDMMRRLIAMDPALVLPQINTPRQWQSVIQYHAEYSVTELWANYQNPDRIYRICPGDTYCRDSVSPLGDMRDAFQMPTEDSIESLAERVANQDNYLADTPPNNRAIGLLNQFYQTASDRGAEVYILMPPMPQTIAATSLDDLATFQDQLESDLAIEILNEPYGIPDFLYYDTIYHLSALGKALNTRYIGTILQGTLPES